MFLFNINIKKNLIQVNLTMSVIVPASVAK